MTCAKKIVTCCIYTKDGQIFTGENACLNPQLACPRAKGEGYDKCKSVCQQTGHAEEMALKAAREVRASLEGSTAYLSGIDHYCEDCQVILFRAGVVSLRMGKP